MGEAVQAQQSGDLPTAIREYKKLLAIKPGMMEARVNLGAALASGHWLDVALRGTKSNRDGIGARIKVVSDHLTQYNHMTTSVGYASSSDGPVHFGLGPDTVAKTIEIRWPSGIVQVIHDAQADHILKVTEPAN